MMMTAGKTLALGALAGVLALSFGLAARAGEDPFADQVETRHGLMLAMQNNLAVLGAVAKGDSAYDQAADLKAAQNVAALASVLSMDYFPAGSENGAAGDSFAKAELWANTDDFLQKVAELNTAAAAMVAAAGTSGEALTAAMPALGKACAACHEAYRVPEE